MCGIGGILALDGAALSREPLDRMAAALAHRGPDGAGLLLDGELGFAHTRLAIIDLSPSGRQPMADASGRFWIVYNGEVYNHRALRNELERDGARLRSTSDTEVIVEAFARWGEACLPRLDGMFAFAVWDRAERRVTLARDRLGIKPLYVYRDGTRVAFASEVRALLATGLVPRALDPQGVTDFLYRGNSPAPHALVHGVRQLAPGNWLSVGEGADRSATWWRVPLPSSQPANERALVDEIAAGLERAVVDQMVADVPVGAFLSSGVDSSAVVALMQRHAGAPVRTFTIASTDPRQDESTEAAALAAHLGTGHTSERVDGSFVLSQLETIVGALDQPRADFLELYAICRHAARHVKVAMSGAGGDELFAGYFAHHLRFERLARAWQAWPASLRRAGLSLARLGPAALCATLDPLVPLLEAPDILTRDLAHATLTARERLALLEPDFAGATSPTLIEDRIRAVRDEVPSRDAIDRLFYQDLQFYLVDNVLSNTDIASMAHGLEVRVPMLDHRLVELAARVPASMKVRDGRPKWALLQALERVLPPWVLTRPKKGFGIARKDILRGALAGRIREVLSPASVRRRGVFRAEQVDALVTRYYAVKPWRELWNTGGAILNLFLLELWARRYLDVATPDAASAAPLITLERWPSSSVR